MDIRKSMSYMRPYDIHKSIINEYILKKPGDTNSLRRDTSEDKTDLDILTLHHKFLWEDSSATSWEQQFAKKYYDKLFKEYCIGDLSRYKENKIALRWRTEQEVVVGKGQFVCANKKCTLESNLKTWEVNFAYLEMKDRKNALVKIRLCPKCSDKLNYHSKKREVKRLKQKKSRKSLTTVSQESVFATTSGPLASTSSVNSSSTQINELKAIGENADIISLTSCPWTENNKPEDVKSRDEEMEDYLDELLL